jgi:hypothetical protein
MTDAIDSVVDGLHWGRARKASRGITSLGTTQEALAARS